ncbi:MAG: Mut7-C RNAse domain-containing protein [Thermodesulfobacteriota bacterium]
MRFWIAPHLAFLVQWLRVLGVDVRVWNKRVILEQEEETFVQWVRYPLPLIGIRIKRITLYASTREALLKEFFDVLDSKPRLAQMFKRCLRCNDLLIPLNQYEAKQKWPEIPEYVLQTQKHFNWCNRCRKVYWGGTHVRNMIRTLEGWGIISTVS